MKIFTVGGLIRRKIADLNTRWEETWENSRNIAAQQRNTSYKIANEKFNFAQAVFASFFSHQS